MPSRVTMLEDLLRSDLLAFINSNRAGNLPEWSTPAVVIYEDIPDNFFDIRDVKNVDGSIKCDFGNGEASYFNGDEGHSYLLRFIRYEEFVNQFRIHQADGAFVSFRHVVVWMQLLWVWLTVLWTYTINYPIHCPSIISLSQIAVSWPLRRRL